MITTIPTAEVLRLHEQICRCPRCKGECDPAKLCDSCWRADKAIDELKGGE